jgi:hypothetical protein
VALLPGTTDPEPVSWVLRHLWSAAPTGSAAEVAGLRQALNAAALKWCEQPGQAPESPLRVTDAACDALQRTDPALLGELTKLARTAIGLAGVRGAAADQVANANTLLGTRLADRGVGPEARP